MNRNKDDEDARKRKLHEIRYWDATKYLGLSSPHKDPFYFLDRYSTEKTLNFIKKYFKEITPFSDRRILDLACGYGTEAKVIREISPSNTLVMGDISVGPLKSARTYFKGQQAKDIHYIVLDGDHLPFKDKSFDISIVREGLHHLPNPYKGIIEMERVTQGYVSFNEPHRTLLRSICVKLGLISEYEYEEHEDVNWKALFFSKKELAQWFRGNGINEVVMHPYFTYRPKFLRKHIYLMKSYRLLLWLLNSFVPFLGNKILVVFRSTERKEKDENSDCL